MKPSEFLEKKYCICFRDDGSRELYSLSDSDEEDMTDENILKELDAHFINKEELKEKIKDILEYAKSQACIGAYNDKDYLKIYEKNIKKILELLK